MQAPKMILNVLALIGGMFLVTSSAYADKAGHFPQKGSGVKSAVRSKQDVRTLEPGVPIERELAGGESHIYRVTLGSGQYLHVVVDQRGIDVIVMVLEPDGKKLAEMDSPNGTVGPESVSWIGEVSGDYRLEVRSLEDNAAPGCYEIKIEEPRDPTPEDRIRIAAERAFAEGGQLDAQGSEQVKAELRRQAIAKYEEALPLWQASGDRWKEAETLSVIGEIYHPLGQIRKALDYLNRALPLRGAVNDFGGEARTLNYIGSIYDDIGDKRKALEMYNLALPLRRVVCDRQGEANTLNGIGKVYDDLGEKQKALESYNRALPLWQAVQNRNGEATTRTNIGSVFADLGEKENTLHYYNEARSLRRDAHNPYGEATMLHNIGRVYFSKGEKQMALRYLKKAYDLLRDVDYPYGEAYVLNSIGSVYYILGQKQEALKRYSQALQIRQQVEDRDGEAYTLNDLGLLYSSLGEKQKALDYYNQALRHFQAVEDPKGEAATLYNIARVERDRGNLHEARNRLEKALDIIEHVRTSVASKEYRASYLATVHDYYELSIDVLMQQDQHHPSEGYGAAALHASERARARSLLELLAEGKVDVEQGIDPELKQQERVNQTSVLKLQTQLMELQSRAEPDKSEIDELWMQLHEAEVEQERLKEKIREKYPQYADLVYPRPLELGGIQSLLDDQTGLLEYSLGRRGSFLFIVTKRGFLVTRLPSATAISGSVDRLRQAISEASPLNQPTYIQEARWLHQKLIEPARKILVGKKRLIIVPDGILYYLPFEALLRSGDVGTLMQADSSHWPYLIRDYSISYVPSATVLASLRDRRREALPPTKVFLAYADPIYGKSKFDGRRPLNLKTLKYSQDEVKHIAALYRGAPVELFMREQATEENAKDEKRLSQFRYIHFAVHGLLNENKPEYSGLVLSLPQVQREAIRNRNKRPKGTAEVAKTSPLPDSVTTQDSSEDGLLQVYEIFNLRLNADMVVLSACETGLGKQVRGEGVIGLTRAFLYAGTPSVVVSLWQVRDRSTAELMVQFYRHLAKGQRSKAEALKEAKLALIGSKEFAHPHYWAPFILVGQP
jgi:CHAT domain-containing protein